SSSPPQSMPAISDHTMKVLDMVNTAAGTLPQLPTPVGVGIGAVNNAAHIYNEGLTQRNVIEAGSTALNLVPALAPINAVRGMYDAAATVTGNEAYTSTALVDRGVTAAVNRVNNSPVSTPEIEKLAHMSFG